MQKKQFTGLLVAAVLALLPLYTAVGFTDAVSDKRAELNDVQYRMQLMEQRREAARRKAASASAQLSEIVGNLGQLQEQALELQAERDALQEKIDTTQEQLDKKQREMDARHKIYSKRLRDIYISGQINYLDVLLGAKDFGDFSSRMYLLQQIISRDLDMLAQMQKDAEEIQKHKDELAAAMKEIKATQTELENKQARANRLREQRSQMLYKAEEDEQQSQEEYDRLLAVSENIASMLRQMEANGGVAPAPADTGGFMWPCRGEITSYYGWRTHPIFGTTKYHSGMDIAVDYGTPIHAANSGKVVYSGWLGGYGYCVMIDHGGGLVTLYGHNQSLNVYEGQYVQKGAVIAAAGSTGYSTGPHCHFEVRLHGEVTEPLNYLPN